MRSDLRVGLVLGGGGAVGAAYHAGALTALEHDLGWDARAAEVIVGTSAGSLVGALLRLGVPATDLAALTVGTSTEAASESLASWIRDRPSFPPITLRHLLHAPRLPSLAMLVGLAKLTAKQRIVPMSALSMLLPDGHETLAPRLEFLDSIFDGTWPDEPLVICAVRRRDWRRTLFSVEHQEGSLSTALAASCAVPGYFAGVRIGDESYVDGGVISATNADVLARCDLDLVMVVSPMTGNAPWPSMSHLVRRLCRRTLEGELRSLRRHGIPTVVVEPGADVTRHMSMDFMSEQASTDIVRSTFFDTGAQIANNPLLRALKRRDAA
jgi:NTE family protein